MHTVSAAILGLVVTLPVTAAVAGSGNDRCVNTINNDARQVVQAALKHDRVCVQRATTSNVTACVDGSDPKTDLKKGKLASDYTTVCSGNVPIFGLAAGGAPVINAAAESAANKVTHDLFGATVIVGTDSLQRCQEKVEQRLGNLGVTIWREFRDCKRKNLANLASSAALASTCLGAPNGMQPDPKSKIARRQEQLAGDIQKHCVDRGISPGQTAFPGLCSAASSAAFAPCVGRQTRCRLCEGIKSADGFGSELNCDRFDDGLANFSCGPAPTPTATRTPTATHSPTLTPTATNTVPPTSTATVPAFCQAQVPLPGAVQVPILLAPGSATCGGAALNPPPSAPLTGSVSDGSSELGDLGLACLYAGNLSPVKLPDGATARLGVVGFQALPLSITLGGSPGTGPNDCTLGAGPGHHCVNGSPGTNGSGLCTSDADCGTTAGACAIDANCYFGPPLPITAPLPSCIMNAFLTDLCGAVHLLPPGATFSTALSSRIYVTGNAASPCPQCIDGACSAGKNVGQPCTPIGSTNTAIECPPNDGQFFGSLTVVLPQLGTGTTTITADANGIFCDGQTVPGAFGLPNARNVTETGSPPGLVGGQVQMNLAGAFCIPSASPFLNTVGGFPGPGAFSAAGALDISGLLPFP